MLHAPDISAVVNDCINLKHFALLGSELNKRRQLHVHITPIRCSLWQFKSFLNFTVRVLSSSLKFLNFSKVSLSDVPVKGICYVCHLHRMVMTPLQTLPTKLFWLACPCRAHQCFLRESADSFDFLTISCPLHPVSCVYLPISLPPNPICTVLSAL